MQAGRTARTLSGTKPRAVRMRRSLSWSLRIGILLLLAAPLQALAARPAAAAAGGLDRSFGGDGRVTTLFGGSDSISALNAIAVQGDGKVVAGLEEGVSGMKVGGKRKLIVPPALGYGASGRSDGSVPPGAELTFEVELVKFDRLVAQRTPGSASMSPCSSPPRLVWT